MEEGEEFEPREGDEMMSLDLTEVSQCVLPGNNRNEIELQFPESDTVEAGTDQLGKEGRKELYSCHRALQQTLTLSFISRNSQSPSDSIFLPIQM